MRTGARRTHIRHALRKVLPLVPPHSCGRGRSIVELLAVAHGCLLVGMVVVVLCELCGLSMQLESTHGRL